MIVPEGARMPKQVIHGRDKDVIDIQGYVVKEGDRIAYATRHSSSLYMHTGRVSKIVRDEDGKPTSIKVWPLHSTESWRNFNKMVTLTKLDRLVLTHNS
jgi:hypothetical protein